MEANNGSSGQSLSDFTILELQNKIAALEAEVENFTSTNKQIMPCLCPSCSVQCHKCLRAAITCSAYIKRGTA